MDNPRGAASRPLFSLSLFMILAAAFAYHLPNASGADKAVCVVLTKEGKVEVAAKGAAQVLRFVVRREWRGPGSLGVVGPDVGPSTVHAVIAVVATFR